MPIMDLTYPQGALDQEAKSQLADGLTTALLSAERAPNTDFFRDITWLYVHELPTEDVLANGKPVAKPTFRLDVTTPQGALSERRRAEMVEQATQLIRDAAGIPEDEGIRVWVLCREIDEGSWGAGGQVIQFEALRNAAKAEREQAGSAAAPA